MKIRWFFSSKNSGSSANNFTQMKANTVAWLWFVVFLSIFGLLF